MRKLRFLLPVPLAGGEGEVNRAPFKCNPPSLAVLDPRSQRPSVGAVFYRFYEIEG